MKKRFVGIFAVLLCVCLLFGGINAFALTPSYQVSDLYIEGGFYDRLIAYELTGDNRYDVISVALTQLGYHEGDSEEDFDGLNVNGGKNFVEYNRMYGKVDNKEGNGVSFGYAWCASFVTWCLRQAAIPYTMATNSVNCGGMMDWYERNDMIHMSGDGYLPVAGDIIFFSNDSSPSHVGLVFGVYEDKVYTIEGNNGGTVAIHSYELSSDYVLSYCVPKYNESTHDLNKLMMDNINKTGEFVVKATSLNVRSMPSNESEILGALNKNDTVMVTALEGSWGKIEFEGAEGYVYMPHVTDADLMVYTVRYDLGGGEGKEYQRKLKGNSLTLTDSVPTKKGFSFVGWTDDKDSKVPNHKAGDVYSADADLVLYAIWEPETYTVSFYDDDGSLLYSEECDYNDWVPTPEEPTKESDGSYSYSFAGWSPEPVMVVVKDLEYTATYTATPISEASAEGEANTDGEASAAATQSDTVEKEEEPSPLKSILVGAGIGAALGAVIGLIVALIKRKKK